MGFELVWIVAGLGGSRVEDRGGSACRPRQWRGGDQLFFFFLVIMWWLFLVDVTVVGGFWRLKFCFFSFVVVVSCGYGCGWWWIW